MFSGVKGERHLVLVSGVPVSDEVRQEEQVEDLQMKMVQAGVKPYSDHIRKKHSSEWSKRSLSVVLWKRARPSLNDHLDLMPRLVKEKCNDPSLSAG